MEASLWTRCVRALEAELPEQQFNTWVRPLQVVERNGALKLLAPNRFVVDWVNANLLARIGELLSDSATGDVPIVTVEVGSRRNGSAGNGIRHAAMPVLPPSRPRRAGRARRRRAHQSGFHVRDASSKARAISSRRPRRCRWRRIPGHAYNPLFLYGGVGLGKTHLMHAIAHLIKERDTEARVAYVHSERFVGDMVRALQHNKINEFKTAYRSLDALLIDDIQFFAEQDGLAGRVLPHVQRRCSKGSTR